MARAAAGLGCGFRGAHNPGAYREGWDGRPAVIVTNNATDTDWWQDLAGHASAMCLVFARLYWMSTLQGQTVLYFGDDPAAFRAAFRRFGWVVVARRGGAAGTAGP